MDFPSRPRGRKLAALAALVVVLAAVAVTVLVAGRRPVPVTARTLRIAVTDGPGHDQHVSLDATFFTPPGHGRGVTQPWVTGSAPSLLTSSPPVRGTRPPGSGLSQID
jgi:hypothetical protein